MSTSHRPIARMVLLFSSAVALCASLLTGCGSGNAAPAPLTPTTIVLVHGAWADGSSWTKVASLLQQRGAKVVAVQLARASLAEDAAIVRRAIEMQPGQVVLVGHSYGGIVVTEAGTAAKVAALVYVSAFAPGDGESLSDITSPYPAAPWQAGLIPDSAGFLSLSTATFIANFCPDLPPADAAILAAAQGPLQAAVLQQKITQAAWKTKPSWWVLSGADLMVPPAFQQVEATRIGATVTTIPGASHAALLSHPKEVADVIIAATSKVNGI